MNKKQFTTYLRDHMIGMTYEQKMALLQKIQEDYIPSVINECKKKEGLWVPPNKKDKYLCCDKCKKYTLKIKCKSESKSEVRTEKTYVDAGYGDDDRMGEVEYWVAYMVCPQCGHKQEVDRFRIRIIREWNVHE